MSKHGFSVRILLSDGEVGGVQFLEVANWTGLGILTPRDRYYELRKEDEFKRSGVYILTGPDPGVEGAVRAYIGRAELLYTRIDAHAKEKDWWDSCLCFTTSDNSLTPTQVQYLEAALLDRAVSAGQVQLDNTQLPEIPRLGRAERQDYSRFLETLLLLAGLAGTTMFEIEDQTTGTQVDSESQAESWRFTGIQFHYRASHGFAALGRYESRRAFIVEAGSVARATETSSCPRRVHAIRAKLIDDGVLIAKNDQLVFTADHAFSSPSLAASVVYGGSANGRSAWADSNNMTINDLDEHELEVQEIREGEHDAA